jgi:D-serine deaminase-like pyridoxal phosphate-dependent protein
MAHGIDKFKCATIAEAEMLARCDVHDVMFAYQAVGPKIQRLLALCATFPDTTFSAMVDDPDVLAQTAATFSRASRSLPLFVDLNVGTNRTGIEPGEKALALYRALVETPGVEAAGLHVYDGHAHAPDVNQRRVQVEEGWARAQALIDDIRAGGLPEPLVVVGGSPSFPIHANRPSGALRIELSPGTSLLWDRGYAMGCPDLPFEYAAVLLTRVVSKPCERSICVDLGYKSVASDMQPPRAWFPEFPDAKAGVHNEEHLVLESDGAQDLAVGTCLYAIPWHICPTVALHAEVTVVEHGRATGTWLVAARDRRLTI